MKKSYTLIALLLTCLGFAQNNPEFNLDVEPFNRAQELWDFKLKPFKRTGIYNGGKVRFSTDYDSLGNIVKTQFYAFDWISVTEWKYRGKLKILYKTSKIAQEGELALKDRTESQLFKVNFDAKGKIIDGESGRISVDGVYRKTGNTYYNDKEFPIRHTEVEGKSSSNMFYKGDNLISDERIYETNNTIDKTIKNYQYKNDLLIFSETVKQKYVDGKLIENKQVATVDIEYKGKLMVKKVFKKRDITEERIFKYDKNGNMTYYSAKEIWNADKTLKSEKWYKFGYENNLKVTSEVYDSTNSGDKKIYKATFEYQDGLLYKTYGESSETKYFYNEYRHLIKKVYTNLDTNKSSVEEYKIEYF